MGQAGQQRSRQKKLGRLTRKICNGKKTQTVKPSVEKKPPKLRKNIQPGQVLILLASKFRGPYALNGVPMKRVNQRYCIATSTKVDVSSAEAQIK
eukprot:Skav204205  [mRNA]  locus=scaffold985:248010:252862:- [translate_table: standard]